MRSSGQWPTRMPQSPSGFCTARTETKAGTSHEAPASPRDRWRARVGENGVRIIFL
uniref:Uncharacterized protein n=1 Tax=Setaria italica TaxID=4555 RepID=K4AP74_SETIT